MLLQKLDQITLADLNGLVANQVREGKTLEYKREFPTGFESQLVPVLAGISALANTSGGDFLIGIEAKDGIAVAIPGVPLANPDQEKQRLENWLLTGLEPRLPRYEIQPIPIDDTGNYVIIVRVPQSWNGPHRVIRNDKFYGRNSVGKYPLDVSELRTAFTLSEQISERIRNFRVERIAAVAGDEAPLPLSDRGKLLMHLIPLSAFTSSHTLDVVALYRAHSQGRPPYLPAPNDSRGEARLTLEGLFVGNASNQPMIDYYTLLFRTGILEAVYTFLHAPEQKYIPSEKYERDLLATLYHYLQYLKAVEIEPPLYLFLTLVGVRGYGLRVSDQLLWHLGVDTVPKLGKDVLQLPEVVLQTLDVEDPITLLRPLFDLVWNTFGFLRSYNFDQNGRWTGQR